MATALKLMFFIRARQVLRIAKIGTNVPHCNTGSPESVPLRPQSVFCGVRALFFCTRAPRRPMGDTVTRYHVAIDVDDKPGVLASVATLFAEHGVSIQTVRQEGRDDDAQLVVVTHSATDAALVGDRRWASHDGDRAWCHLGHAGRGSQRVSRPGQESASMARRDRGVPRLAAGQ